MFKRKNNQPTKNLVYRQYYSSATNRPVVARGKKHHAFYWIVCLLLLATVGFGVWEKVFDHKTSPKTTADNTITLHVPAVTTKKTNSQSQQFTAYANTVNSVISSNPGITFEVTSIDLSNNSEQQFGGDAPMTAASVEKILTAIYYLHQVEAGDQSLSETINGHTAEYEIQRMIVVSDDNAWDAINNVLGYPQMQAFANQLGITDYNANNNTLSATDIANLLAGLYEGKLLNQSNTQLLMSYLLQANYRQYIVPAVPSADTIYHKIGLYNDNVNDAAIITNGKAAFVLVIFTNGNGMYNWPMRAQLMQEIAKSAISAYLG